MAAAGEITVLLRAVQAGKPGAVNELIGLIYSELRHIAQRQPGLRYLKDSPQPTALVHEAFLRLFENEAATWENRRHFFWAASRAMRDILIEEARRFATQKRGGQRKRVELTENIAVYQQSEQVIELDEVLTQLSKAVPEVAEVVMLHFYGGLTHADTAKLLEVSSATVRRRWAFAKAWIHKELHGGFARPGEQAPLSAQDGVSRLI